MQQSLFAAVMDVQAETPAFSLDTPVSETVFTVIDVETTGFNPKNNSLTEVTAIQFKNGEEVAKYSTLVKPSHDIPPEVEQLTGITMDMVKNAPALVTVLSELAAFVGNTPVIVGHNVAFDIKFLREKFQQSGMMNFAERFDMNRAVCTRMLAVKALPGLPSYEGIVVASHCGVANPNPHRAEYDVRMSAGILFSLINKLQAEGKPARTVKDLVTLQGPLS